MSRQPERTVVGTARPEPYAWRSDDPWLPEDPPVPERRPSHRPSRRGQERAGAQPVRQRAGREPAPLPLLDVPPAADAADTADTAHAAARHTGSVASASKVARSGPWGG